MMSDIFDIGIIGCGPAGLSAAVNTKLKNRSIFVLGSQLCSPPLHRAPRISNYLGFPAIKGDELRHKFLDHAHSLGIEIIASQADSIFQTDEGIFQVISGSDIRMARTVIIATGVPYKNTFPAENKYLGRGLAYCATCDGPLYAGSDVAVIAYSAEAETEANYLMSICRRVVYIPVYKGDMKLDDRIQILNKKPLDLVGDSMVEGLKFDDELLNVEGVFVLGAETAPDRLVPGLELEEDGIHIKVNRHMETSIPGIYAAGDCTGAPYQLAKSIGEGQLAGFYAAKRTLNVG